MTGIFILDADNEACEMLSRVVRDVGQEPVIASTVQDGLVAIQSVDIEVIIIDSMIHNEHEDLKIANAVLEKMMSPL